MSNAKILCVDDEKNVLRSLIRLFMDEDYEMLTALSAEEGLEILQQESPVEMVISDYRMPGMNGVDFLKQVHERWPDTIRMVLSGYADTASVVAAINEGQIFKFIPKPWNDEELKVTVAKALELYDLRRRNEELTSELRDSNEELQLLNQNLEKLVEERTAELTFQNRMLTNSQHLLDSLPVGVLGLDLDGSVVQANREARQLLGREEDDVLVGRDGADVLPEELLGFLERLRSEKYLSERCRMRERELVVRGNLMRFAGGQEGLVLAVSPLEA